MKKIFGKEQVNIQKENSKTDDYLYSILTPCLCNTRFFTLPSHIFNKKSKYILHRHFEYRYFGDYKAETVERIEENIHCIECAKYDFYNKLKKGRI